MLQVVTSNNLERGLIPTQDLIDNDFKGFRRIIRSTESKLPIKFFNVNESLNKFELFAIAKECTINERFIFTTGEVGKTWFKLNFPLSYVRYISGEQLFIPASETTRIVELYRKISSEDVIDEATTPIELYDIQRKEDSNGNAWLEVYPRYRFGRRQLSILSNRYKELLKSYYLENAKVFSKFSSITDNPNISEMIISNEKWITKTDSVDIFSNGGWYILKNKKSDDKNEYYFGKADHMSNRIKWQNNKIGHPPNPNKEEPLFDYYNSWYVPVTIIENIVNSSQSKDDSEKLKIELFQIIMNALKMILSFVTNDMKCNMVISHQEESNNNEIKNNDILEDFYSSYLSMMLSNIYDADEDDKGGEPHYVFNSYSTSWKSKEADNGDDIGNVWGLLITKANKTYNLSLTNSLKESISHLSEKEYFRYIVLDLSRIENDIETQRKLTDIYSGFLYGVEGLVNDIVAFIARDLNHDYYNDAYDKATNVAYNNMIDHSKK